MNIFNLILVQPITNILVAIYQALLSLHVPSPLGFSILTLTITIRFLLLPLMKSQLQASKKMQAVQPHVSLLKEKHKGDAKMLQSETMKLYKEHGVNPVAGCLPALIQLPIIFALYNVLRQVVNPDQKAVLIAINKMLYTPSLHLHHVWDAHFFGLPLGQAPSKLLPSYGWLILLVPLVTAFLQMIQAKMMFPQQKKKESDTALAVINQKSTDIPAKKTTTQEDFAAAMQTQSIFIIPLVIGYSSFTFPLGLSLYWNTFTIFGIIQQYSINGLGGLQVWVDKLRHKETNI